MSQLTHFNPRLFYQQRSGMSEKDSGSAGSDKSRRRRGMKNTSARCNVLSQNTCKLGDTSVSMNLVQSNSADVEAVTFLSSPQSVYQVVSSFESRKKNIVESIGFGGILRLPCISYQNKEFSLWLLKRVKWLSRSLTLGDNFSLTLKPEHIGKITGLSCSGTVICSKSVQTSPEDKIAFISNKLGFLGCQNCIVVAAEKYIVQQFPSILTKEQIDNFKIAFVIFVMGRFLAPSSHDPDGKTDFWSLLENPDELSSHNWSCYVLSNIFDAACLADLPAPNNKPLSTIVGCPLILEIFYLDNIDFGPLNLSHEVLPRWQNFSNDSITAMIQADKRAPSFGSSRTVYGRTKLLRASSSCYTYGNHQTTCTPPIAITPSSGQHTSHRGTIRENCSTPEHSSTDQTFQIRPGQSLPLMFKEAPKIERDAIDFSAFIRDKYQGQVDSQLLLDCIAHNARCLSHMNKSYRSLVADIVNENIKIATKFIEQHSSYSPSTTHNVVSDNCTKRKRHNEMFSATDSSTEGEDNIQNSKVPRSRLTVRQDSGNAVSPSLPLANSNFNGHIPDHQKGHLLGTTTLQIPGPSNMKTSCIPSSSKPGFSPSSQIYFHNKASCLYKDLPINKFVSHTPEATIKMPRFPAVVSPSPDKKLLCTGSIGNKKLDSITGIDLNASSFEMDYSRSIEPKKIVCRGPFSLSHWEMNLSISTAPTTIMEECLEWLASTNKKELDSYWVVLSIPRSIKTTGWDLKYQFALKTPMSLDLFDVAVRRIKQLDSTLYPSDIPLRWRHFLQSDFALNAFASDNLVQNKSIRNQFIGPSCEYEISRCQMIFVPVHVDGIWWCYCWDLKAQLVFIIDPSVGADIDSLVINKHSGTILKLSKSLSAIATGLFSGWEPKFDSFKPLVLRFAGMPYTCYETGIITLFCLYHFDGSKLAVEPTETQLHHFRAFLLFEIIEMKENGVSKPIGFLQNLS